MVMAKQFLRDYYVGVTRYWVCSAPGCSNGKAVKKTFGRSMKAAPAKNWAGSESCCGIVSNKPCIAKREKDQAFGVIESSRERIRTAARRAALVNDWAWHCDKCDGFKGFNRTSFKEKVKFTAKQHKPCTAGGADGHERPANYSPPVSSSQMPSYCGQLHVPRRYFLAAH